MNDDLKLFRSLASHDLDINKCKETYSSDIYTAILIREVENAFLDLFNQGKMNGTVHTCVGQEFSGVAINRNLNSDDWITSNHRCHGHFISKTGKWKELIDELRGFETGICKGIGSSQHLFTRGFLSNGPQAALIPVGTGIAKHLKDEIGEKVCVSFFGEGTLGEGLVYESMNLASILDLPQVFVLENNLYSQSTPQDKAVSGSFELRARSFNLKYFTANTWDLENLFKICEEAVSYSRKNQSPCFVDIKTYRLNAHSKSDDDRDIKEIEFFHTRDPVNQFKVSGLFEDLFEETQSIVQSHISSTKETILSSEDYFHDQLPHGLSSNSNTVKNPKERMINQLNLAYKNEIENGSYFIGEDIIDPYGGAFKVTKGLSTLFPDKVIGTPISEAAITGLGIGLSLMGHKSYVEIMFGDFISYSFDQIMSNASKFYHMYGFQCSAPVRIRTPMGGKRGYGPTHSQSLEKFLLGIDNVAVFALSSLINPVDAIKEIRNLECPAIIIENKVDYAKKLFQENEFLTNEQIGGPLGPLLVRPKEMDPDLTIISYGGTAREIADGFLEIFEETDFVTQIICLTSLNPLNLDVIMNEINKTTRVVSVEDGSTSFGIGSEIISKILAKNNKIFFSRIGAKPYPIPSIRSLEDNCLPTLETIIKELKDFKTTLENQ